MTTVDDHDGAKFDVTMTKNGQTATMTLARLVVDREGQCRAPITLNTPQIDAGPVYGHNEQYLKVCSTRALLPGRLLHRKHAADMYPRRRCAAPRLAAVASLLHTSWIMR